MPWTAPSRWGTGDLGIGNTTPSAAIPSVMTSQLATGREPASTTKDFLREDQGDHRRIHRTEQARQNDAVDVSLSKAPMATYRRHAGSHPRRCVQQGSDLHRRLCLFAGALIVVLGLCPTAATTCPRPTVLVKPGHDRMWKAIGKEPLDLNFRLGEGTGGAVAMHLASTRHGGSPTTCSMFSDAGVTNADSVTVDTPRRTAA